MASPLRNLRPAAGEQSALPRAIASGSFERLYDLFVQPSWLGLPKKFFDFFQVLTRSFLTVKTTMDKANLPRAIDKKRRRHRPDIGRRDELLLGIANDSERD